MRRNCTLLLLGASGGIGIAAIQIDAALGARVIACASSEQKLAAVGGPYTEPALRSMAWGGRLLVVGFASGEIPKIPLNLVLLKGCAIVSVFWGEFVRREPPCSLARASGSSARGTASSRRHGRARRGFPAKVLEQQFCH